MLAALSCGGLGVRAADSGSPHGPLKDKCEVCHRPDAWRPARIDRSFNHSKFAFPLEGVHRQTDCRACHMSLVFAQVPSVCAPCHQDPHVGELGDDCGRCHTPRSFIDRERMARAHQVTRFPLQGAHLTTDCDACHARPSGNLVYVNLPSQCSDCHLDDYLATSDPDHQASGFSTDCRECHTQFSFRPARFVQHDTLAFPIYSGKHRGKWTFCTDCHINPSSRTDFSCLVGCHQHDDPTRVTSQHAAVSGFTYESGACYACHPDGRKP
jgi:hypothetical protein